MTPHASEVAANAANSTDVDNGINGNAQTESITHMQLLTSSSGTSIGLFSNHAVPHTAYAMRSMSGVVALPQPPAPLHGRPRRQDMG